MIIGNGLIAQRLKSAQLSERVLVLASGVANSQESNESEFKREEDLLLGLSEKYSYKIAIYFSTTSIYSEKPFTPYVQHKLNMEKLVGEKFNDYLILRLPIVVSNKNNSNQLFGYIRESIKNQSVLTCHKNACRNLLDVDAIPIVLNLILDNICLWPERVVNVCSNPPIRMENLFQQISEKTGYENIVYENTGECYKVKDCLLDYSLEIPELIDLEHYFNSEYLLKKYL